MKLYLNCLLCFFLLTLYSCSQKQKEVSVNRTARVHEAKVYVIDKDSIEKPKIIPFQIAQVKKIPVGKPETVLANTNVHEAETPQIHPVGVPFVATPGKDTFLLAKPIMAIDSPFVAGIPEVEMVKDFATKDQNPQGFSYFGKLQGLKHGNIRCLLQDKSGKLWFGTNGGGVSCYDGRTFAHYTEKEGLCNNDIRSIFQDKDGTLWFGSYNGGLSAFDGKYFKNFSDKNGLNNNTIYAIMQDKKGKLWFGTNGGGATSYDGKYFTHYTEKEGLSSNVVLSISESNDGKIWFGTNGGGVSCYDGTSFSHYTEKEGLSNNSVYSILQDTDGNIWFGTGNGLICFNGKTFKIYTEKEGLSNNMIFSIIKEKDGKLWMGTNGGGAVSYDGKTFTHYTEKEGLSNSVVLCIIQDASDKIWLGTNGGGVNCYDEKSFTHFTEKEGLSNNVVLSVLQDNSGKFWFGTYNGGINCYDGKSFAHYTEKQGLSSNIVFCILQKQDNEIWFGTGDGVTCYDGKNFIRFSEKEGLPNKYVYSMMQDKAGNIWIGTGGGVSCYDGKSLTNYTEKNGISNGVIYSIKQDLEGKLWFATGGGGVTCYDGKTFSRLSEKEGLSNNVILCSLEDKNGNLWLGTNGGGVDLFDGKTITHFSEKEGLSNNVVLSIIQDQKGNLVFGTRFGLSILSPEKHQAFNQSIKNNNLKESDVFFKNITYEDGFLGIGVYRNAMYEDKAGNIWIGANDRLTVANPEGIEYDNNPPNIQLTSVGLFNEKIGWTYLLNKKDSTLILGNGVKVNHVKFTDISPWYGLPENLSLMHNNNYLTFSFIGIVHNQPKKVKYQYKLEGIDENWSAITGRNEVAYGNLPNGVYSFKVKAMNSDGIWSKPFTYTFTIRPPWWKTWLFRTAVVLAVLASFVLYINWRERSLKFRQKVLQLKIESATVVIRSQKEEVEKQKELVEKQKQLIEQKHKEITDSINYAERIQRSFLACHEKLDSNLNQYFVFYKPKDVVSGDFYWGATLNNHHFALATADSTGHGVPGTIMSFINITSLEKAVELHNEPSDILSTTRKIIIDRLKKDGSLEGGKDGMDASLIIFNPARTKFLYASANSAIWVVRNNELIDLKPDKMPVGKHDKDFMPFTQNEFNLQKNDMIYTLTDGFASQFGGPKGKKYKTKPLKNFLTSIASLPAQQQFERINQEFENWKGAEEQIDDITVIGMRI